METHTPMETHAPSSSLGQHRERNTPVCCGRSVTILQHTAAAGASPSFSTLLRPERHHPSAHCCGWSVTILQHTAAAGASPSFSTLLRPERHHPSAHCCGWSVTILQHTAAAGASPSFLLRLSGQQAASGGSEGERESCVPGCPVMGDCECAACGKPARARKDAGVWRASHGRREAPR